MVDLHTHILPFMDDGSASIEETIAMLTEMKRNGVTTVVATPHFDLSQSDLKEFLSRRTDSYSLIMKALENSNLEMKVLLGAELMYTPQLANQDLDNLVIQGTDYVLIELSTRYDDPSVVRTLNSIIASGYIPILAHVERYSYLINDSQRLVDLINQGVVMQVNTKSIGNDKYPFINAMIKRNLVHLIASDAHNMTKRNPDLRGDLVPDFIYNNMSRVIRNEDLVISKPSKIKRFLNKYL